MVDTAGREGGLPTAEAAMEAATEDTAEDMGEAASAAVTVLEACPSCSPRFHRRSTRRCPRLSTCRPRRRLEAGEEQLEASRESATGVLQFFRELGFFQFFRNFIFQVRTRRAFAELLPQRPSEGLGDNYEEKFWRMNEAMNI